MTTSRGYAAVRLGTLCGMLGAVLLMAAVAALPADCAAETAEFTVVLLPDTQFYSEQFPGTYLAQTTWIRRRVEADNIAFVIHLGDIVQNHNVEAEWRAADQAHRQLDGAVPYSVLPGNHDMSKERDSTLYNKYFSPARFRGRPWYGGSMNASNDNNYCCFSAGGMEFLVLSLEYKPRDEVIAWANEVIEQHADRRVILATHRYMGPKGRTETGDRLWEKLVRRHANLFLVVGGHHIGVAHQASINDDGGTVHEVLCDYQGDPQGGNGWLQTLRFQPGRNEIRVETYSPTLDEHRRRPPHDYALTYPMRPTVQKRAE